MNSFVPFSTAVRNFFPWSDRLPGTIVERRLDPGAGIFVTKDPLLQLARARLQLFRSSAGAVGIVIGGDGIPRPWIVDLRKAPEWLATDHPCEAAVARKDGSILLGGANGIQLLRPGTGIEPFSETYCGFLLEGPDGGCWTFERGLETAKFINHLGKLEGTFPVSFRYEFVSDPQGRLCYCKRGDSTVQCLQNDGQRLPQEGYSLPTFANILSFGEGCLSYLDGTTLNLQLQNAAPKQVSIANAGLTFDGRPFVSSYLHPYSSLTIGNEEPIVLKVPDPYTSPPRPVTVVAVDAQHCWAKADGWGLLFDHDGNLAEAFPLTEEAYRDRLFPRQWTMTSVSTHGKETVLLPCSGPTGIAILELSWQ